MQEMQELKEIIENGRINLLPAERVAENILAAGYRQTFNEKRFENNMKAVLEIEKKQAVKEFAEMLKNRLSNCSGCYIPDCFESPTNEFAYNANEVEKTIDELLKEKQK